MKITVYYKYVLIYIFFLIKVHTTDYNTTVYGFMRVKNEEKCIYYSLFTLAPFINNGVIGYNDITDNSEFKILDFCSRNRYYKNLKYAYHVIPAKSKLYTKEQPYENRLDGYYNSPLSLIPNNNWLLKAHADELYNSYILHKIAYIKNYMKYLICLPRVNIYLINCKFYALKKNYIVNPCDQWLFYKTGEEKFVMKVFNDSKGFHAYEFLIYGNRKLIHYNKVAILHLSHLDSEIKEKYIKNEMTALFNLLNKENRTIIVNKRMIKSLNDMERRCDYV